LPTSALRVAQAFTHASRAAVQLSDRVESNRLGFDLNSDTPSFSQTRPSRADRADLHSRLKRALPAPARNIGRKFWRPLKESNPQPAD
jgi:hypothetical protein